MRAMWLAVAVAGAGLVMACNDSNKTTGPTIENQAPVANFTFHCTALRCDFQDTSTDDGGVVGWNWNFGGDGSSQQNPFYNYASAGNYQVTLTVTDSQGETGSVTKSVNPKAPVVTSLTCVDGSAPGGFVACTLKLMFEGGFKISLDQNSCDAHGNLFRFTAPVTDTLTVDGCYETVGKTLTFTGPFPAGTEISAEVVAPLLANPPQLRVSGDFPVWTLSYEDGVDTDFDDMKLTVTALPN
jgi:PKD repeat protein